MKKPIIREAQAQDLSAIVALNEDEVQWTSVMDTEKLEGLLSLSIYQRVLEADSRVVGFLIALDSSAIYNNENFDWFRSRYDEFLYVDRIVIDKQYARAGLGREFYEDLFSFAENKGYPRIVCEYSTQPMNVGSSLFHARMGFTEVGKQRLASSEKEVSMQSRPV